MKRIDLTGRVFGDLTVLKMVVKPPEPVYCECLCICGKIKNIRSKVLIRGVTKSCGCIKQRKRNHLWRGHEEISAAYWTSVRGNAKKRNLEFSISLKEGWDLFLKQNKCCYFTGETLTFTTNYGYCKHKQTASLDRIDPNKGYTVENVRWIHKLVNLMKMSIPDELFVDLCKKIANLPILEAGKR